MPKEICFKLTSKDSDVGVRTSRNINSGTPITYKILKEGRQPIVSNT